MDGLQGVDYLGSLADKRRLTENGAYVRFSGEVDRIYLATPSRLEVPCYLLTSHVHVHGAPPYPRVLSSVDGPAHLFYWPCQPLFEAYFGALFHVSKGAAAQRLYAVDVTVNRQSCGDRVVDLQGN